jgi:hypothetical protein
MHLKHFLASSNNNPQMGVDSQNPAAIHKKLHLETNQKSFGDGTKSWQPFQ